MRSTVLPSCRTVWLFGILGVVGCGSDHRATPPPREAASVVARDPSPQAAANSEPRAEDPMRSGRLSDLDTLCAALNADYVDGTLSDYFGDVTPKTKWGESLRKEGSEADRPGRFLQAQIAAVSPGAADPALPACRELLDYIDEVE